MFSRLLLGLLGLAALSSLQGAEFRVFPAGELPHDSRLAPLKDLDGYFPFTPPASAQAWAPRREHVRRQMQVALGLWPYPTKTPLNAEIYGRLDPGDYTVEKVHFESMPGFFVTGNLYRPKVDGQKHPGVLCPYGHWPGGRFMNVSDPAENELATTGEKLDEAAHSPLQARCVQLARMGCVVFHYDMLDRGDSIQLAHELPHGFAKQRPEMSSPERWGLFSPAAEEHFQSVMGLQTWDSIRSLDFLLTLPEVDPHRIAVTGASGGATQTLMISALDDRVSVAFPAVMVSTAMQGGCTCENACDLRIGTGNVEFAALFAPKPMGMTSANDWTKEMPTKGFPELQRHWATLGAPDAVQLSAHAEFGHNYNAVSRAAMYAWLNRYLGLSLPPERLEERNFPLLTRDQMSVWDAGHPAPRNDPEVEKNLLHWWQADAEGQKFDAAPAWEIIAGRTYAEAGEAESEVRDKSDLGAFWRLTGIVRNTTYGEELPAVFFHPKQWNGSTVLWLADEGKAGLLQADGQPRAEVRSLVEAGISVIGVDLLYQGEFLNPGATFTKTRVVANPREAAAFTFGYNETVFAQRMHDILTVRKMVATKPGFETKRFGVLAFGHTGPLAALARAVSAGQIDAVALETNGFRFGAVADYRDPMFLPGAAKYGDLPALLALDPAHPLWRAGEDGNGKLPADAATWLAAHLK